MVKDQVEETNSCICDTSKCPHYKDGTCYESTCTEYKSGCPPGCKGCEKRCTPGQKCKCCTPRCGCKDDCYAKDSNGTCKGKVPGGSCERCKVKCKDSDKCICYQCSCGTQCNGFLCACCYFCNPGKCKSKDTCDGYVLGKCADKCQGHGTYDDNGQPFYAKECKCTRGEDCKCYTSKHDRKCRCIFGEPQKDGNCLIKCDMCGKLCSQDSYVRLGTIVVVLVAIAVILLFVWHQYRDKLRKMFL
ncbi:hypothetical protein BBBOND_0300420 [Babesia bigemina]|uniref:Uncharacterized protein n=1 Tax=Babesia bigemina TaxID=5866 RepID=A0A061D809_BABBI|nr:hypothetical protein BBBOND_0300420 [Babesia bigemina]CDR96137.1 hypothetical protein BBBOND_0300420 [Babesia bigemina]|eukprot:XP_012768323.1 hypothetical protein BBBOND_0300420 [Babesia bigemina]